jgi:hypothetical protein
MFTTFTAAIVGPTAVRFDLLVGFREGGMAWVMPRL